MTNESGFFKLCQTIGARTPDWVQGAGGNVSEKIRHSDQISLRIKASGYRLDQVEAERGFVDLRCEDTRDDLLLIADLADREIAYSQALARGAIRNSMNSDRASMETGFHLFLDAPFVAHFHSLAAILLADLFFRNDARVSHFLSQEKDFSCSFIDFVRPGIDLALAIKTAPASNVYFLRNHGVILALGDVDDLEVWKRLERSMVEYFGWHDLLESKADMFQLEFPLAVYMPDTAVFLESMLKSLIPSETAPNNYRLKPGTNNKDIIELWAATARLFSVMPDLKQIPYQEWAAISGMPTERFRQSVRNPE